MDGLQWKTPLKWMIWGVFPYFLETPISYIDMHACVSIFSISIGGFIAGRLGVWVSLKDCKVGPVSYKWRWSDKRALLNGLWQMGNSGYILTLLIGLITRGSGAHLAGTKAFFSGTTKHHRVGNVTLGVMGISTWIGNIWYDLFHDSAEAKMFLERVLV